MKQVKYTIRGLTPLIMHSERLARGLQSHARKSGVKTAVRALGDGRFGVWRL